MASLGKGKVGRIGKPAWRKDKEVFEGKITVAYRNGKPFRKSVYAKTEREYWKKALELAEQNPLTLLANSDKITLKSWLTHYVEEASREIRPNTLLNYKRYMSYVVPDFGEILLVDLKSAHLDLLFRNLQSRGLAPSVRQHVFHFLKKSLRRAYQIDRIAGNPMDKLDPPKGGRVRKAGAWNPEEIRKILEAAKDTRWYGPIYFALMTGVRPGELLALRWSDIQEDRVHVSRTLLKSGPNPQFGKPKTETSERVFPIHARTLEKLNEYRTLIEEERAVAKDAWKDFDLVFPSSIGTPLSINNLRRVLRELSAAVKVPYRSPHELRHTWVTRVRTKFDVRLVSLQAGHADTIITDKVYNHTSYEELRVLAITLEDYLGD